MIMLVLLILALKEHLKFTILVLYPVKFAVHKTYSGYNTMFEQHSKCFGPILQNMDIV